MFNWKGIITSNLPGNLALSSSLNIRAGIITDALLGNSAALGAINHSIISGSGIVTQPMSEPKIFFGINVIDTKSAAEAKARLRNKQIELEEHVTRMMINNYGREKIREQFTLWRTWARRRATKRAELIKIITKANYDCCMHELKLKWADRDAGATNKTMMAVLGEYMT